MNFWVKSAFLVIINAVSFYAIKEYYDTRKVRVVSATLPATVEIASVGWNYKYVKIEKKHEVIFRLKKDGFGKSYRGTGVVVRPDGLILTCAHIMHGSRLAEFAFDEIKPDVEGSTYTTKGKNLAYVVYASTVTDIALLKVVHPVFHIYPSVRLAREVNIGQEVIGIGYPGDFPKYVSHGIISQKDKEYAYTDAVMWHGSSGGGVFDLDGHLVGLFSVMFFPSRIPTWQGFGGILKLEELKKVLDKYEDL